MQNKHPKMSLVAAMDKNRVIGYRNQLPWYLPADLRHFKQVTLHKPILMGRNTYLSIGKALPQRTNLVVSRDPHFQPPHCHVFPSIEQALASVQEAEEIMVIGGASIYEQLLPQADRLYLTIIQHEFQGDTYFPEWQQYNWQEIERSEHPADEKNPYAYTFLTLEKF